MGMEIRSILRQAPLRAATGSFLLNSGLEKLTAEDEKAKSLHSLASGSYPVFNQLEPQQFAKLLGAAETALGGALLLPLLRGRLVGLGLTAFAAGLLGLYWRTPGVHQEGSVRPTEDGVALAKDAWLLGIGLALATEKSKRKSKAKKSS